MSSAVRYAQSPPPPVARAQNGRPRTALVRASLRPAELALTATLFSFYVGLRGSARVLRAIESIVAR